MTGVQRTRTPHRRAPMHTRKERDFQTNLDMFGGTPQVHAHTKREGGTFQRRQLGARCLDVPLQTFRTSQQRAQPQGALDKGRRVRRRVFFQRTHLCHCFQGCCVTCSPTSTFPC